MRLFSPPRRRGYAAEGVPSYPARSIVTTQQTADGDVERAIRGLLNSPVPIDLADKTTEQLLQIGIGSYIVNGRGACAGCHTWNGVGTPAPQGSEWVAGGNPFLGQPEMINTAEFMSGGRPFGPFVTRNLTPDPANGLPGHPGMTEEEFIEVIRTGLDRRDQGLLQTMAWPMVRDLTDDDLKAIYAYLKEIPSVAKEIPDSPRVP